MVLSISTGGYFKIKSKEIDALMYLKESRALRNWDEGTYNYLYAGHGGKNEY